MKKCKNKDHIGTSIVVCKACHEEREAAIKRLVLAAIEVKKWLQNGHGVVEMTEALKYFDGEFEEEKP